MKKRRLGRITLSVSQVGFGGTWIAELTKEQAIKVVRHAFNSGINYFDTARWDGDSEEKIGEALQDIRSQCVIATKTGSRIKKEALDDLVMSLRNLRTDYVDILQLHGIDDEKTLTKALGQDGSLQTCKQAQREGLANFIGITGHKPRILAKAIATGEFDMVLVPINVVTRQALEELLPIAKALDVGVVAMKPLFAKTSNLITCLYQPSLALFSAEPELERMLGASSDDRVNSLLRFVLSQDVASVIPGMRSIKEVDVAVKTGKEYLGLSVEEQKRFRFELGNYCRDCGECLPCPQKVNISAILRFHSFYESFGLNLWARKLYSGLEFKVDKCDMCRKCENRCPYNLSILAKLQKAHKDLM